MKKFLVALAALLSVAVAAFLLFRWKSPPPYAPQRTTPVSASIMSYQEYGTIEHPRPYVLQLKHAGGGELLYLGIGHTSNPDDPQIKLIEDSWRSFHPTVAFCESRLGTFLGGLRSGVRQFGEAGAVYALSHRDEVSLYTLEPPLEVEMGEMLRHWSPQQVTIFYTLRSYMSDRKSAGNAKPEDVAAPILRKRSQWPGLNGAISSIAEMDAAYKKFFPGLSDWRTLPDESMWPGRKDTPLNVIATRSNQIRDEHMVRSLIDSVRRGERVFAVVGASHTVMQERSLRAALQGN